MQRTTVPRLALAARFCSACARGALVLLFLFGFVQTGAAQTAIAPPTPPLNFFKNYLVSGDYVVGGVGLRGLGDATGFATGTINIPDTSQAAAANQPVRPVPAGATIVAAFLYWQTVEKSQSAFAGQHGFFNGFPIIGTVLGNPNAPLSWSAGGCPGSSNRTPTPRPHPSPLRPSPTLPNA